MVTPEQIRNKLASIIVQNQPKPIPINKEEAIVIADAIVNYFDVRLYEYDAEETTSAETH